MKRLKLFAMQITVFMLFFLSGSSCVDFGQVPDIDRMDIPRLELVIEVKKIPFSREQGTWDITEETGAAYRLEGTSHPEFEGNTVLAAHYMEYE